MRRVESRPLKLKDIKKGGQETKLGFFEIL